MNRKKLLFISGSVLGAALIVWVILIAGIFRNGKTPEKKDSSEKEMTGKKSGESTEKKPEEEFYEVYRMTGNYSVTDDGKTKTPVVLYSYDKDGNILKETLYSEGNLVQESAYSYDKSGNLTVMTEYDAKGNVLHRYDYTYDRDGRRILETSSNGQGDVTETIESEYWSNGNLKKSTLSYTEAAIVISEYRSICSYNEAGMLTEKEVHYDGGNVESIICDYDAQNRILKELATYNDVERERSEYEYQADRITERYYEYGLPVRTYVKNTDDQILELYEYLEGKEYLSVSNTYDDSGKVLKRTNFGIEGKEIGGTDYSYDEHGNLIEKKEFSAYRSSIYMSERNTYEYDESNRLIKENGSYYSIDAGEYHSYERYFQNGLQTAYFAFDSQKMKVSEDHYEYDEHGNLIAKSSWNQGLIPAEFAYEYQMFRVPKSRLTDEEIEKLGLTEQGK